MSRRSDEGFSLVEVIIAMFLLAVLTLAVLPLLIGAMRLSVTNNDLVAATAFANSRLAVLRDDFPVAPLNPTSCAALQGRVVTTAAPIEDAAPTGLTATIAVLDPCPSATAGFPTSIRVSVSVRQHDGRLLVELPSRIKVTAP